MKLPFDELFHIVFTSEGQMKPCGRDACRALMKRLETHYNKIGNYGDIITGRLNISCAYSSAKELVS